MFAPNAQVPRVLAAAGARYSNMILGALVLKSVMERLLPDVARTLRMWRQFMPIYIRYRWTGWRYQTAKGYSMQVRPCAAWILHSTHSHMASNCAKALQALSEVAVGTLW